MGYSLNTNCLHKCRSCLPDYYRNTSCSTWGPPGIWWIHRLEALRGPISNEQRVAAAMWNCPNWVPRCRARRRIRALFAPDSWCTCIGCIVRLMPVAHKPYRHWCSTERIQRKLDATPPVHSSRLHSWLRAKYEAAGLRIPCECTRSADGTRPVRILQWSASDAADRPAIVYTHKNGSISFRCYLAVCTFS